MKDGCTAASAPSVTAELPSEWEEATTEHSESVRRLNANVWSRHSPGLRHQEVPRTGRDSTEMKRFFSWILFDVDDYRDGWRTGGFIHPSIIRRG